MVRSETGRPYIRDPEAFFSDEGSTGSDSQQEVVIGDKVAGGSEGRGRRGQEKEEGAGSGGESVECGGNTEIGRVETLQEGKGAMGGVEKKLRETVIGDKVPDSSKGRRGGDRRRWKGQEVGGKVWGMWTKLRQGG